jgi:hypothetical protein
MIRTAAAIRASLAQPVEGTDWGSRHGRAWFLRDVQLSFRREFDQTFAARCRSVREQQRWEAREVDGLPEWL